VATPKRSGIAVSAFTSHIDLGNTILYPITDKAPQINLIVQPTHEPFLNGDEEAAIVAIRRAATGRTFTYPMTIGRN
jgi:hypothetical protein